MVAITPPIDEFSRSAIVEVADQARACTTLKQRVEIERNAAELRKLGWTMAVNHPAPSAATTAQSDCPPMPAPTPPAER